MVLLNNSMKLRDFKNEIKVLDIAALALKVKAINAEIGDLIMDKNMNKLKDLKSISKKKKEAARVMTVLNQKKAISKLESSDKQSLRAEALKSLESSEKKEEFKKEKKGVKS